MSNIGDPAYVSELIGPTAPSPEPARQIGFLKGLLFFWLLPRRLGPHLAAGSRRRALAAHVLSLIVLGLVVFLQAVEEFKILSFFEMRRAFARWILDIAATSAGTSGWVTALLFIGSLPAVTITLTVLAILVMPWCAGGDRTSSVLGRSFKNALWCSPFLVIAAMLHWLVNDLFFEPRLDQSALVEPFVAGLLLIGTDVLLAMYLLRLLLVGASRYVGSADGPAFKPREPSCDDCGYPLVGLPVDSVCPECGLDVPTSLTGGRRQPTGWHENEFKPSGLVSLLRLQKQVLLDRAFFKSIPVHHGLSTARHFWWGTFFLICASLLLAVKFAAGAELLDEMAVDFGPIALTIIPLVFGLQSIMMFAGCLWGQFRHKIADYRVSALVCYYASPLQWPIMVLFLAGLVVWILNPEQKYQFYSLGLDTRELVALLLLPGMAWAVTFWWLRVCRGLSCVRFANV